MTTSTYLSKTKIIWEHKGDFTCTFKVGRFCNKYLLEDIYEVRHLTDPRWPDQTSPVDVYSDLYCFYHNDEPVGCVGATQRRKGPVFMEEYVPLPLLDYFQDCIVSAYRFRLLQKFRRTSPSTKGITPSYIMIKEAWKEQLRKGIGIDIINVETSYLPLYARLGYLKCDESDYLDPVLGTPSCIMYLPVDPTRRSIIQDVITEEHKIILADEVQKILTRKSFVVNF